MDSQVNRHSDGITDDELFHAIYLGLLAEGEEPTPPTEAQAAEIVRRAKKRRRERLQVRLRILRQSALSVSFAACLVVGVVLVADAIRARMGTPERITPDQQAAASPTVLTLPDGSQWKPARTVLTELAATVRIRNEARPAGRYTYTRTRGWSIDTTSSDPYQAVSVRDEQRWWASDLSGRETVATVSGWIPGMAPGPIPTPDPQGDIRYTKGLLPVVLPQLADNVFGISSQLADQGDPADGPQQTLRAVREVYRYHAPTPPQRADLLQALADTDGLMSAGIVDGGSGRRGLAITVDSDHGATRDIAIFDPTDGRLLAYDTVVLRNPPQVTLPTPAISDSVLFIAAGRTGRL